MCRPKNHCSCTVTGYRSEDKRNHSLPTAWILVKVFPVPPMSEVTGSQLIRKHRHRDGPQCAVTQTGGDEEGRVGDKFHEVVWTGDEIEPAAVRYVMVHVTTFTCTRTNTSLTCYK